MECRTDEEGIAVKTIVSGFKVQKHMEYCHNVIHRKVDLLRQYSAICLKEQKCF